MTIPIKTPFRLLGKSRDRYLELVQEFPLVSIQSEQHLREAQQVIDSLLAQGKLDVGATTYLDALSDLVGSYEDKHYAIEPASDAEMLRHFMEAKDVSQAQLCHETGLPKSTVSEMLAGRKPFSRHVMRTLAEYFRVDVSVFAANI